MGAERTDLREAVLELASVSGVVANVCDHAEHNEPYATGDIERSGERLRSLAVSLAHGRGRSPVALYRDRLRVIEWRNVVHHDDAFDGPSAIQEAISWRALQLVQLAHDRYYHADVAGLSKSDQLRHYALHVAKIAGAAADTVQGRCSVDDFVARRVADTLLFGLKLATVAGQRLSADLVPERRQAAALRDGLRV